MLLFEFIKWYSLAAETILLAFQNYILMLGTNVMIPSLIVPAMGGDNVSAILRFVLNSFTYKFNFLCSNSFHLTLVKYS